MQASIERQSPGRSWQGLRRWWPALLVALLFLVTTAPYLYAVVTTPPDRVYTGLMLDAPDTLQYFSWMYDHHRALLVANRMTAQPNSPALFNLLWLVLAQIQRASGWSDALIFQVLRLVAGCSFAVATWVFYGLIAGPGRTRGWTWVLAMCGGGLGALWVVDKYVLGLNDVRYPLDLYVAEPNTPLALLSYPHFLVAGALIVLIFWAALRGARGQRGAWPLAALFAALLALQHAYDLLTVYAVLGGWLLLLALQRRRLPWTEFGGCMLVGLVSLPPAVYFTWLTSHDPIWRAVLSQFGNAGVWTPPPLHLLILVGIPLVLAILGWDDLRPLRERSAGELLIKVWGVAGCALIYLPVSFQIHLLNPWQVPLALLAVWAVERRIVPLLARRHATLTRWALPVVLILALPTNAYLIAWRFVDLSRHVMPYYLSTDQAEALGWLTVNTGRSDVVLSDLSLGPFIAARTGARTVLAHWAQTVDFYRTSDDVGIVLATTTAPSVRRALLHKYDVTYLVASTPLDDSSLRPAWSKAGTTIYRVETSVTQAPNTPATSASRRTLSSGSLP